ncbi:Mediator of DNA damage checkpoint protein 1 [Linnemannia exigua]|uniref:Mediator of DNA damage checkpoint protein 1 n=1 Tax=Linnemannia exigua TaxID=604196 RepID=A0AAD4DKT2_9FUNG|nr:Mediator of DNA damage checkpoint protein 1 [Linnemannia exigua]
MSETNKSDDDKKAVARLKIHKFRDQPERLFYLYKGVNTLGRDPFRCNIWLTEEYICREHLYIDVVDEDDILVQDGAKPKVSTLLPTTRFKPGQIRTMFGLKVMESNTYYEFSTTRKLKLANLLTCQVEKITKEERETAPLKGVRSEAAQKAIELNTHMNETFVGGGFSDLHTRSSRDDRRRSHTDSNNSNNNRNSDSPQRARSTSMQYDDPLGSPRFRAPGSEHSFDSTQVIPDLTQVVHEEEYRPRRREPLADRPVIPGLSPDITLQRPVRGGPGSFLGESRADFSRIDNRKEFFKKFDESSQLKDIHTEPTMVILEYPSLEASQSSVVLPETQPTQILIMASDEIVASDSLPESVDVVSSSLPESVDVALSSLLEEGIGGVGASEEGRLESAGGDVGGDEQAGGSRSGSVVPESPPASQQDVIPCTPVDQIGQDRIPQTPEHQQRDHQDEQERRQQQQHAAMSDVSTLEANQLSSSIPDSQATQEAVGLSVSSSTDLPLHHDEEEHIVKVEKVEQERRILSVDSQIIVPLSPRVVKAEDDHESTRADDEFKSRRILVKDVICPDSQHSTQPSSRDRSKDDIGSVTTSDVTVAVTAAATTSNPQGAYEPTTNAVLRTFSQDSDRTASREGTPKHHLEEVEEEEEDIDAAADKKESSPKPAKLMKIQTMDSVFAAAPTTKAGRTRRGAAAGSLSKSMSADPMIPGTRRLRSGMEQECIRLEKNSVMISSPDKESLKVELDSIDEEVYNDRSYKEMALLVYDGKSRTCKLMCAIARGLPIVSTKWLTESFKKGYFLPTDVYLFQDKKMEKDFHFNLQESCAMGRDNFERGILIYAPYEFYCVTKNDIPSNAKQSKLWTQQGYLLQSHVSDLVPLVEICGGRMLLAGETPDVDKKGSTIVIGQTSGDCAETQRYIEDGFKVVNKEFVMACVLRQQPDLDFETHAIKAQILTTVEDDDEEAEQSDSTTSSNPNTARSRSRSSSVVPQPLSRKSSTTRPQRTSSTISASSVTSIPAPKKKKPAKKK